MAATSCTRHKLCCEKKRGLEWIHPAGGLCQDDVTLYIMQYYAQHSTGHYVVSSVQNIIHIRSDAET